MDQPSKKEQRKAANEAIWRAVRNGTLLKPDTCEDCGGTFTAQDLHAHHHNGYAPEHRLDVRWLCAEDHGRAHGRKAVWWFTTEQARRGQVASVTKITHEQRVESGRRAGAASARKLKAMSPEQVSEMKRRASLSRPPEQRVADARRAAKAAGAVIRAKSPEELSDAARRGWKTRRANGNASRNGAETITPEQRAAWARQGLETRRANGTLGHTGANRASALKGWETRRARQATRFTPLTDPRNDPVFEVAEEPKGGASECA